MKRSEAMDLAIKVQIKDRDLLSITVRDVRTGEIVHCVWAWREDPIPYVLAHVPAAAMSRMTQAPRDESGQLVEEEDSLIEEDDDND